MYQKVFHRKVIAEYLYIAENAWSGFADFFHYLWSDVKGERLRHYAKLRIKVSHG
jgi:hypothetical protein